jgi:hypothetical protein
MVLLENEILFQTLCQFNKILISSYSEDYFKTIIIEFPDSIKLVSLVLNEEVEKCTFLTAEIIWINISFKNKKPYKKKRRKDRIKKKQMKEEEKKINKGEKEKKEKERKALQDLCLIW